MTVKPEPARLLVGHPPTPKGRQTRTRASWLRRGRCSPGRATWQPGCPMWPVPLGCRWGGLYRYFGDKEELLEALIGGLHEELFARSTAGGRDFARAPYAGMVITGAAARPPRRVRRLVYSGAYVPADGDSCYDLTTPAYRDLFIQGAQADGLWVPKTRVTWADALQITVGAARVRASGGQVLVRPEVG